MPHQPTGNVTFLFTDIVGSTEMWEQHGDSFLPVLQAHNAILNEAITRYGGHLFKTEGDAYKVAFTDPAAAVKCAILAQAALQRYPWPADIGPLSVRMAVHSGTPFVQSGDYFGPPVNRAARILSSTHGGQILVSDETARLAASGLERGTELLDQGPHQLRDLDEPIRLHQVAHPALRERSFPAPRSLNAHEHNLPTQRRSFIGRQREIEHIASRFAGGDTRLITLTGPQGAGKTRLAMQASAEYIHLFSEVWIVSLANAVDVTGAAIEVADAIGLSIPSGASPLDAVRDRLANRSSLLILDDVGSVPQADRLIRELLTGAPSLRCLATSREPVQTDHGEMLALSELSKPTENPSPAELMASESGRLFVERAQESRPEFDLTPRRARSIGRLLGKIKTLPATVQGLADSLHPEELVERAVTTTRQAVKRVVETPKTAEFLKSMAAAVELENPQEAERRWRDVLQTCQRLEDRQGVAEAMRRLGNLAFKRKEFSQAVMFLSHAHELFHTLESKEALGVRVDLENARRGHGNAPIPPFTLDSVGAADS